MVDGACRRLLQSTWKWNWGDLRRTQWHSCGSIFTFWLQGHMKLGRIQGSPNGTKTCQRGQRWSDSKVVAAQINKVFHIWDPQLLKYYLTFERLGEEFKEVQVIHIIWEVNDKADKLAQLATSHKHVQLKTFIPHSVLEPSISGIECL